MDNDLVQSNQQKKLAEQLIKKKYQAWKLLAIGFLLGFTIFTFSRFYLYLRNYLHEQSIVSIKYLGSRATETTYDDGTEVVNYPASGISKPVPAIIDKNLNDFVKKFHHAFLLIYVLTQLTALILITAGVLKYLDARQKIEKLKER